ncbi:MAG: hypothetical protein A2283_21970 [Lentisphaerae bacterium RIFOXYA12_FULL_48_11]|nr:MAG: hypothetical protein A2283_21970 [Lentisphaerae bacterium RIFOXYA12_FULL_48_11]
MKTTRKWILWYVLLFTLLISVSVYVCKHGHIFIATFIIVIPLAMVINGWIAEIEDRSPGGFLNPNDSEKQRMEQERTNDSEK